MSNGNGSGVGEEHICCAHQQHFAIGGPGCCARGHAAYLMATGQRTCTCVDGEPNADDCPSHGDQGRDDMGWNAMGSYFRG